MDIKKELKKIEKKDFNLALWLKNTHDASIENAKNEQEKKEIKEMMIKEINKIKEEVN